MKRLFLLTLVLLTAMILAMACSTDDSSGPTGKNPVAGIWNSELLDGDVETIVDLNLMLDGQYNLYRTVKVDGELDKDETLAESGSYDIEGTTLIMSPDSGDAMPHEFELSGSTLTLELWGKDWELSKRY